MDNQKKTSKEVHETALQLARDVKEVFTEDTEAVDNILRSLSSAAREIHALRLKEITGFSNGNLSVQKEEEKS